MTQYSLVVREHPQGGRQFRAFDRLEKTVVFEWHGRLTSIPVSGDQIPQDFMEPGVHLCDKATLWHLILAATAAQLALEQNCSHCATNGWSWESEAIAKVAVRAAETGCWPRGLQRRVALALFAHETLHLRATDLLVLLLADGLSVSLSQVQECLTDLVDQGFIQNIVVAADYEFYDVDIQPHPHVYDAGSEQLWDIHPRGVLQLGQDQLDAAIKGPACRHLPDRGVSAQAG